MKRINTPKSPKDLFLSIDKDGNKKYDKNVLFRNGSLDDDGEKIELSHTYFYYGEKSNIFYLIEKYKVGKPTKTMYFSENELNNLINLIVEYKKATK